MRGRAAAAALLAATALAGAACEKNTALDGEACARNCITLAAACPGFDGTACLAACEAADMSRVNCIEDIVQAGHGECPDFVKCFPGAADVPGGG